MKPLVYIGLGGPSVYYPKSTGEIFDRGKAAGTWR